MIDPPGTCHLVGCPDKGKHPPHPIGTPDSFTPYQQPSEAAMVLLQQGDVEWLLDALVVGTRVSDHPRLQRVTQALAVTRNITAVTKR